MSIDHLRRVLTRALLPCRLSDAAGHGQHHCEQFNACTDDGISLIAVVLRGAGGSQDIVRGGTRHAQSFGDAGPELFR